MRIFRRWAGGMGRILILALVMVVSLLMGSPVQAELAADEAVFTDFYGEKIGVVSASELRVKWQIDLNDLRPPDPNEDPIPDNITLRPEAVDVTSDGSHAVIGSWKSVYPQLYNRIDLVDLENQKVEASLNPGVSIIEELDIAPDDSFAIATGSGDGMVSKFTLKPFKVIGWNGPWDPSSGGSPQDVHLSSNGTIAVQPTYRADFFAVVDVTGDIPVLIDEIPTPLSNPDDPDSGFSHHGISLSQEDDDTFIATGTPWQYHITIGSLSESFDPIFLITPFGPEAPEKEAIRGIPEAVDITCDGTRAVVETSEGLLWIKLSEDQIAVSEKYFGPAQNDGRSTSTVAFSSDGSLLFVGNDNQIDVYDATTNPPRWDGSIPIEGENAHIDNVATLPCSAAPEDVLDIAVAVDIKPQSCPNPINTKSNGVLPVAILGTADVDVEDINPDSIQLEGVPPIRWEFEDVATPHEADAMADDCLDCNENGPDGVMDLTLKFDTQEIVAAIGSVSDGQCLPLAIDGQTFDKTVILGEDIVRIIDKKKSSKKGK